MSERLYDLILAFKVVERFEKKHGKDESRGACHTIADEIAHVICGKVIAGFVRMPQGEQQHYWVEKDEDIIDPLTILWADEPYSHKKVREVELREKYW